jgi:Glycosyl transferases group 1
VREGHTVEVAVFNTTRTEEASQRQALSHLSLKAVHVFPVEKGHFTLPVKLRRRTENLIRKGLGYTTKGHKTYAERTQMWINDQHLEPLVNLIAKTPFDHMIVTGAWVFSRVADALEAHNVAMPYSVVDLHDVFFRVDEGINAGEYRFAYNAKRYKRLECEAIARANMALCISPSDYQLLADEGLNNLVECTGDFIHMASPLHATSPEIDMVFGFIGSDNSINQAAVQALIHDWWPKVKCTYPQARLKLAGDISTHPATVEACAPFRDHIQLDGFIDHLDEWYHQLCAVFLPNPVQGGLNFKGVEALIKGRPVLCSEATLPAFAPMRGKGIYLFKGSRSVEVALNACPTEIMERAMAVYTGDAQYHTLLNALKETPTA